MQIARNRILHSFGHVHFYDTTNYWCRKEQTDPSPEVSTPLNVLKLRN